MAHAGKPPWGHLVAINCETRERSPWRVPLGTVEGVSAKTDQPNLVARIVANGMIFLGRDYGRDVSRL